MLSKFLQRRYFLRSKAALLSASEARGLIARNDFYCCQGDEIWQERNEYANPQGQGFHMSETNAYALYGDGEVVYDQLTGLLWQRAGSSSELNWREAKTYVAGLNEKALGGQTEWRLPTLEEAMSLMEPLGQNYDKDRSQWSPLHIHPVFDVTQRWILTADYFEDKAWKINFAQGSCDLEDFRLDNYVRVVCGDIAKKDIWFYLRLREVEPKDLQTSQPSYSRQWLAAPRGQCSFCKGTGKQPCQICNGSGSVTNLFPGVYQTTTMTTPCPTCAGSGLVPCHSCHGSGST